MDLISASQFIDRMHLERKELQDDIKGLSLNKPNNRIGNFGCGKGYATWCLRIEVPNSECIGIDKFDLNEPLNNPANHRTRQFSLGNVANLSREMVCEILSGPADSYENSLSVEMLKILMAEKEYPVFRKGDLITGEGVSPEFDGYFDLIYCKRVFSSIYNKDPWNDIGIEQALHNIAKALKPDGWFCLVEIKYLALDSFLKRAGFEFKIPRFVLRPYRTRDGNIPSYPYAIYQCHKKRW